MHVKTDIKRDDNKSIEKGADATSQGQGANGNRGGSNRGEYGLIKSCCIDNRSACGGGSGKAISQEASTARAG